MQATTDISLKEQGVVMAFGVFDLLHEGHRSFLSQAATHGSRLIVVVTPDKIVQLLKKRVPHDNEKQRLQKVKMVPDVWLAVLGDTQLETYAVVKKYKPDLICFGYDQEAFANNLKQHIATGDLPNISLKTLKPYKPELYHSSLLLNTKQHQ